MSKLAFLNGLVLAFETIRTHKLRAFLTVLGVIIGTGTIIGVAAILTGFDANVTAARRSGLGGGLCVEGDAFHVCSIGGTVYLP